MKEDCQACGAKDAVEVEYRLVPGTAATDRPVCVCAECGAEFYPAAAAGMAPYQPWW